MNLRRCETLVYEYADNSFVAKMDMIQYIKRKLHATCTGITFGIQLPSIPV